MILINFARLLLPFINAKICQSLGLPPFLLGRESDAAPKKPGATIQMVQTQAPV
jgi:hypothetical protein